MTSQALDHSAPLPAGRTVPRTLRFAPFELDLLSLELRRSGELVRLQPQPAKVLALLAQRSGQPVLREEIQREVWGAGTYVDFEHGLNFCIRQIRSALRDDAAAPRFIETLPRRGYRFVARVEAALDGDAVTPPIPPARSRDTRLAVLLVAALSVAAALSTLRPASAPRPAPPGGTVRLAVLPFDNLTGDAAQDYVGDGLAQETITRLAGVRPDRLGVIARTSALRFKGDTRSSSEIARALGVPFLLEGSVRRSGDRLRVTAQLVRASDATQLWADSYDGGDRDVLALQSDVAGRVAQAVVARLVGIEGGTGGAGTSSAEAYDSYLKGRYHLGRGAAGSLQRAVSFLDEAIDRDPGFAAAYVGLAEAWVTLGDRGLVPSREAYPRAKAAAEAALVLDPESAEAWVFLGVVRTYFEWDLAGGAQTLGKAVELNPGLAIAHHYQADYLAAVGRRDEAVAAAQRAQALDPLSRWVNEDVGWYSYFAGRHRDAARHFRRVAELEPQSFLPHVFASYAEAAREDWPAALAEAEAAMHESGTPDDDVARLLAPGGRDAYLAFLRRALAWQQEQSGGSCPCFALRAELGDREGALADLERARDQRWRYLLVEVGADPRLAPLRSNPRFQAIEREIGLRPRT